jgi:hypothetical protein
MSVEQRRREGREDYCHSTNVALSAQMPDSVPHFETRRQLFPIPRNLPYRAHGACQAPSSAGFCLDRSDLGGSLWYSQRPTYFAKTTVGATRRRRWRLRAHVSATSNSQVFFHPSALHTSMSLLL